MKQNIMYGALFALLVGLGSFGVSQAYAQQYSRYGGMDNSKDLPQTTNQDVLSRFLDVFNEFVIDIKNIGNTNNADLQTIIQNQNTEIQNEKTEIGLLEKLVPQVQQPTVTNPATQQKNCHMQHTGVICG